MNIKEILANGWVQIAIIILIAVVLIKMVNFVFRKIQRKRPKTVYMSFIKSIIQAVILISTVIKVGGYSDALRQFSSTILMSSSLLIVVAGFVFQEGLSNIVHGFILLVFKPFDVGDRIQVFVNGETISGFVKEMNLRHTKITATTDNAPQIIPNSKLDLANIKNFSNGNDVNKYPLKIDITYKDGINKEKRELAKQIVREKVLSHPLVVDLREDKSIPLFIKVDLTDSTVRFTILVVTNSYEDNITALSEITENILDAFSENDIDFAYPHTEISGIITINDTVSGELNVSTNDLSNPTYVKEMVKGITTNVLKGKKDKKNTE